MSAFSRELVQATLVGPLIVFCLASTLTVLTIGRSANRPIRRYALCVMGTLTLISLALASTVWPEGRPRFTNDVSNLYHVYQILRAFGLVLASIGTLLGVARISLLPMKNGFKNVAVVLHSLTLAYCLLEAAFTFIPVSHAVSYALAARNWFSYYWAPINSEGYRDREHPATNAKKIVVIGDSFVAGHGLTRVEERFSDRLQQELGPAYEVYNLGVPGANSEEELNTLRALPFTPHHIVLSYIPDDFMSSDTNQEGLFQFRPYDSLSPIPKTVVMRSYLANYLFWLFPQPPMVEFYNSIWQMAERATVQNAHTKTLRQFGRYSQNHHIPLTTLLFPLLRDPQRSKDILTRARQALAPFQDVQSIEVSRLIADMPMSATVINNTDDHPSAEVHRRIAEHLLPLIAPASQRLARE